MTSEDTDIICSVGIRKQNIHGLNIWEEALAY